MKHMVLISVVAAVLGLGACGRSNLALDARKGTPSKEGQKPGGDHGKPNPSFIALPNADNIKLRKSAQTTRQILLKEESARLSFLCTDNFELSLKSRIRLKLLGGGQVLLPQDTQAAITETSTNKSPERPAPPKEILNVMCDSPAAGTENLEAYDNVKTELLTPGSAPKEVEGKFMDGRGLLSKIQISCLPPAKLTQAEEILFSRDSSAADMILSSNTLILIETGGSPKNPQYVLVKCGVPAAPPATKSHDETLSL